MASSSGSGAGPGDPKGIYSTLGVATSADEAEIRKAYRRLALKWHPDKNPDNPEATAEFQRISAAYEVLSDADRRRMYDSTGCVDEEELGEPDFDHAADIFAAFFGGAGFVDMEEDEQAMMDEFLRMAGGAAFRQRRGRGGGARRRGRGGARSSASRAARQARQEEQMLGEFMAAMAGGLGGTAAPPAMACPQGHTLKRRKADAEYQCDLCERRVVEGKKFFDCRRCDFSVCQRCQKEAEQEAAAADEEGELHELIEAICDECIAPVRSGRRLQFRCKLCEELFESQENAQEHVMEAHDDEVEALLEEATAGGGVGMDPFGGGGLGEFLMFSELLGGGLGGPGGPGPGGPGFDFDFGGPGDGGGAGRGGGGGGGGGRRSRKKR